MSSDCSLAASFSSKVVFTALNLKIRTPQWKLSNQKLSSRDWV